VWSWNACTRYIIIFIFVIIFLPGSAHFFQTIQGEVSDGQQLFYSQEPNNKSCAFSNKHTRSRVYSLKEVFLRTFFPSNTTAFPNIIILYYIFINNITLGPFAVSVSSRWDDIIARRILIIIIYYTYNTAILSNTAINTTVILCDINIS